MRIVVDLETNGHISDVTKLHCAIIQDVDSSYSHFYCFAGSDGVDRITEFLAEISVEGTELIFHNGFSYDLCVLAKLFNWYPTKNQKIHDTFILSQLLFADLRRSDEENTVGTQGYVFQQRDCGSHSLKAWGQRLMCFKGEYNEGWDTYTDAMGKYCIQDGLTTKFLFLFLETQYEKYLTHINAIDTEYLIAPILARQSNYGVLFDVRGAEELTAFFLSRQHELKWQLLTLFPPTYKKGISYTPKSNNRKRGYTAGATFTRIHRCEFNPNSRTQIVDKLTTMFNWKPTEFTPSGKAKLDEQILDNLPFKELAPLKEYLTLTKRLGQINSGRQAWLKQVKADGRIHGGIMQNGTMTGRMAHFNPNLGQVVAKGKMYGKECRKLFIVPKDKIMVGIDADALEMRCLAHYLTPLDNGRFMKSLLDGNKVDGTDPHTLNMLAYGLTDRECAKTEFYGDIYGSRNAKKGKILLDFGVNLHEYVPNLDSEVEKLMCWYKTKTTDSNNLKSKLYWECWVAGKELATRFGNKLPELGELRRKIHRIVTAKGYLLGLDGRKLFMRSEHAELNTLLQSAGAILMKKALYFADQSLQNHELVPGRDYEFILNVHDEWQLEVSDISRIVDIITTLLQSSLVQAAEFFKFRCPLKGNVTIGRNWSETH